MDINKIEKRLSDLGQRHEESVDTAALWKGVSQELERKKRRPIFIWLFFGLALGSALLFGLGVFDSSSEIGEEKVANLYLNDSNQENNEQISIYHSVIKEENQENDPESADENRININHPDDGDLLVGSSLAEKNNVSLDISNQNQLENSNPQIGYQLDQVPHPEPSYIDNQGADEVKIIDEKSKSEIPSGAEIGLFNDIPEDNKILASKTNATIKKLEESKISDNASWLRANYILLRLENEIAQLKLPELSIVSPERSLLHRGSFSPWRVGLYGGVFKNNLNLNSISIDGSPSPTPSYLKRKASVSPLLSLEMDFEIGYRIRPQLYIVSGLQYRNISSRSRTELITVENILQEGVVIEQVIGPDGVEEITGEAMVTRETRSLRSRISSYKELSIPLYIEYVTAGSVLSPFVGVGIDYSFLLNRSGLIHLNDAEEYNIELDPDELLASTLGLSFNLYGGLRYRMSNGLYLNSRIGFMKELFSHFNTQSTFSERYSMIRFQLGMEHHF